MPTYMEKLFFIPITFLQVFMVGFSGVKFNMTLLIKELLKSIKLFIFMLKLLEQP